MLKLVLKEDGTEVSSKHRACVCVGRCERAKPERGSPGKPQTSVSFSSYLSGFSVVGLRSLGGHALADQQQLVQCYTITGMQ